MSTGDFDFEPVRGLPQQLPAGETMLWQGAPDWRSAALRIFHVRKVAIYFALLFAWRFGVAADRGEPFADIVYANLPMFGLAAVAIALLCGLAWLTGRTTVYTITNKRIVMRIGIALPVTWNLPYTNLEAAGLKTYADGTGNIALTLNGEQRLAYLIMWPHVRPWYLRQPQPMLRLIPDAARVAKLIAEASQPYRTEKAQSEMLNPGIPARPAGMKTPQRMPSGIVAA